MKHVLFALFVLFGTSAWAQTANDSAQDNQFAAFEVTEHNFGDVTEEEDAVYEFVFVNTSGQDLILNPPKTSCGCTTPYYPKEPIANGESEAIKVRYSTKNRPGKFNKTIRVYAQGYDDPIYLKISGEVKTPQAVSSVPKKAGNSLFK